MPPIYNPHIPRAPIRLTVFGWSSPTDNYGLRVQPAFHCVSPNPTSDTTHSTLVRWDLKNWLLIIPIVGPIDDTADAAREYRVDKERRAERVSTDQVDWPQKTVHLADECRWSQGRRGGVVSFPVVLNAKMPVASLVRERAKRVQMGKAMRS